jgi:zinc transporter 1/2/3
VSICAAFVVISLTVSRYCVDDAGEDVQILVEAATTGAESTPTGTAGHSDGHSDGHASEEPAGSGEHCHDHAGIP